MSGDFLKSESIEWAFNHINKFGDTDIFPIPFEYELISYNWTKVKDSIEKIDLCDYATRSFQFFLVLKQYGGYRPAIQLDPIDTIIYTALAYEVAPILEKKRVPKKKKIACSYRIDIKKEGALFQKNNGWDDFHDHSRTLAQSKKYQYIVTADIADFYNHISHHRVRNALEDAGISELRARNIENFFLNLTKSQSRGIPIGPIGSVIFSEACLNDVDHFLFRKKYVHTRYVDDFRIFCKNEIEAQKAIHDLSEYLYTTHRLSLQLNKTKILKKEDFLTKDLIDPKELEASSIDEKIEALINSRPDYPDEFDIDSIDFDSIIRKNLIELFLACLNRNQIHFGTAKYLLRRATRLKTSVLQSTVLEHIDKLLPIIREVTIYLKATTKRNDIAIGELFLRGCQKSDFFFLPTVRMWVLDFLIEMMADVMEKDITKLCNQSENDLGLRPYALFITKKGYVDWVRQYKETLQNKPDWDRRAIIWASQTLSPDEMRAWLSRAKNKNDILEEIVATGTRHKKNNITQSRKKTT